MTTHKKIPKFKTDEEIATFWDTHDFTDFVGDTDPADDVIFERPTKETLSIRLEHSQITQLKKLSRSVGLGYTSLIRSWVIERLAKLQSSQRHRKAS